MKTWLLIFVLSHSSSYSGIEVVQQEFAVKEECLETLHRLDDETAKGQEYYGQSFGFCQRVTH